MPFAYVTLVISDEPLVEDQSFLMFKTRKGGKEVYSPLRQINLPDRESMFYRLVQLILDTLKESKKE